MDMMDDEELKAYNVRCPMCGSDRVHAQRPTVNFPHLQCGGCSRWYYIKSIDWNKDEAPRATAEAIPDNESAPTRDVDTGSKITEGQGVEALRQWLRSWAPRCPRCGQTGMDYDPMRLEFQHPEDSTQPRMEYLCPKCETRFEMWREDPPPGSIKYRIVGEDE